MDELSLLESYSHLMWNGTISLYESTRHLFLRWSTRYIDEVLIIIEGEDHVIRLLIDTIHLEIMFIHCLSTHPSTHHPPTHSVAYPSIQESSQPSICLFVLYPSTHPHIHPLIYLIPSYPIPYPFFQQMFIGCILITRHLNNISDS